MALHVALTHRTEYTYDRPTSLGPQIVRLRPAPHSRTPILSYSLNIEPKDHFINWQQDPFGNYLARLVFPEKTREFKVVVDLVADMATINPFDFFVDEYAGDWPFEYDAEAAEELGPYLKASRAGAAFAGLYPGPQDRGENLARFHLGAQPAASARHRLSHPHGARRADAGGNAQKAVRLLPRFGLAARCTSCAITGWRRASCRAI